MVSLITQLTFMLAQDAKGCHCWQGLLGKAGDRGLPGEPGEKVKCQFVLFTQSGGRSYDALHLIDLMAKINILGT